MFEGSWYQSVRLWTDLSKEVNRFPARADYIIWIGINRNSKKQCLGNSTQPLRPGYFLFPLMATVFHRLGLQWSIRASSPVTIQYGTLFFLLIKKRLTSPNVSRYPSTCTFIQKFLRPHARWPSLSSMLGCQNTGAVESKFYPLWTSFSCIQFYFFELAVWPKKFLLTGGCLLISTILLLFFAIVVHNSTQDYRLLPNSSSG